jgi:hypothetical protein
MEATLVEISFSVRFHHFRESSVLGSIEKMVRPEGFEPPTLWFVAKCSIQLSYGRTFREMQPSKDIGICALEQASKLHFE